MSLEKSLTDLFDAERAAIAAEDRLLAAKPKDLVPLLTHAVDEAYRHRDHDEASLRLRRLALLCGEIEGSETADALIKILGFDDPGVRQTAGDALEERAYDRYAEFARAVDRALDSGIDSTALLELPHLIAAVGEPSALLLLRRFLAHSDAEVVAETIGAIAELGDPNAISVLRPYAADKRTVSVADEDDEDVSATIGQLAEDAIQLLESAEED